MININDKLDVDDTYSLALLMLSIIYDEEEYKMLTELIYLLDHDSFVNLIKYYGDKKVRIPSINKVKYAMQLLLLYSDIYINKMSPEDACEQLNISIDDYNYCKDSLYKFNQKIESGDYRLGGLFNNAH